MVLRANRGVSPGRKEISASSGTLPTLDESGRNWYRVAMSEITRIYCDVKGCEASIHRDQSFKYTRFTFSPFGRDSERSTMPAKDLCEFHAKAIQGILDGTTTATPTELPDAERPFLRFNQDLMGDGERYILDASGPSLGDRKLEVPDPPIRHPDPKFETKGYVGCVFDENAPKPPTELNENLSQDEPFPD